ncbi:hypothetical protein ABK040_005773 [Willaertia magna]
MANIILECIGWVIAFTINLIDIGLYYLYRLIWGVDWMTHDLRGRFDKYKEISYEVDEEGWNPKTETKPRISVQCPNNKLLDSPVEGVSTMNEYFAWLVKTYKNNACLGHRIPLRKIIEKREGIDWEVIEFGDLVYETYEAIDKRINNFAAGVVRLTGMNSYDRFGIFDETRKEWLMALHACFRYNITSMTVYASLGDSALISSINECEVTCLLVNEKSLTKIAKVIQPGCPTLKTIIYTEGQAFTESEKEKTTKLIQELTEKGLKVYSFEEVEKIGENDYKNDNVIKPREVATKESLALIMYTSGSTGNPKGILISHKNILSIIASADVQIGDDDKVAYVYCAYLPLAHILEMAAEHVVLKRGGRIGYANPKTLTDKGARPKGDLEVIAPGVLVGVPRVFDTIKKGALEKLKKSPPIVQWLFNNAFSYKLNALYAGRETPLWNLLVFKKFKQLTGGRLALILSGGAALSKDTHEFLRVCLSCCVIQGYGLTETSAGACLQCGYGKFQTGSVGTPVPSVQVKLVSVPEMNYLVTDNPPRGEIVIKGHTVTMGYYKQEELTKESYGEDGYFKSGDIAVLNPNGSFSIIDRKKNLIKLSQGEYIAIEKLESIYGNSPFIAPNGIMVYGDSEKSFAVALIILQPGYTKQWAHENGLTENIGELLENKQLRAAVKNSLLSEAKKANLQRMEEIKDFRLLIDEWTPENELLTSAMKLKRPNLVKKYKDLIDEMYEGKD